MKKELEYISQIAYSTKETIQNSYDCAIRIIDNNIDGDIVECGVGAGSQIASMCQALKDRCVSNRKIWAFDSYQGIPIGTIEDEVQAGTGAIITENPKSLISSGVTVHSLSNVQGNLIRFGLDLNYFNFVEGWFQDTLPIRANDINKISILRLDGDLYESTKVCLNYLFDKLVSGGVLIIDDWALVGCRKACDEYFGDYSQFKDSYIITNSTPKVFIKK